MYYTLQGTSCLELKLQYSIFYFLTPKAQRLLPYMRLRKPANIHILDASTGDFWAFALKMTWKSSFTEI